jgi:hypothetical protein
MQFPINQQNHAGSLLKECEALLLSPAFQGPPRSSMKYFVTVLMLLLAATANAAEMPKELQGYWCNAQAVANGKYVRCKEDDAALTIERKMIVWEEGECQPLSVRNDGTNSWVIREHCINPDIPDAKLRNKISTTRYTRRGVYLYVK